MLLIGGGGPEAASIREGASDRVRAAEHRRPVHAAEIHPPGAGCPPRRAWRSKGKGRRQSLPQSSLLRADRALHDGKVPTVRDGKLPAVELKVPATALRQIWRGRFLLSLSSAALRQPPFSPPVLRLKLLMCRPVHRDGNGYPKPEYPTGFTR
jgi:hypothetical protein